MSLATVRSCAITGAESKEVIIEVHLSRGLPAFSMVGLAETAVKESKDRVRAAILNSGFEFPRQRITVNLAPADLPKEGGGFDLAIALGLLAASGQLPVESLEPYMILGELALSGECRPVSGALIAAIGLIKKEYSLLIPVGNRYEVSLVKDCESYICSDLLKVAEVLIQRQEFELVEHAHMGRISETYPDLDEVVGQSLAKLALEVAAAGFHSLLFSGTPGAGKSMLTTRLPGIMPSLTETEALEIAANNSISSQGFNPEKWKCRPFRAPHHSASRVAMIGGGARPKPGEISLAHHGVLFLDELPEFDRHVLEALREPMESGYIDISRAAYRTRFKSLFLLAAACNPCPCGYYGDLNRCKCSLSQVKRYQSRISGPLMDRIDLKIQIAAVPIADIVAKSKNLESSKTVKQRVSDAVEIQFSRQNCFNSHLKEHQIGYICKLDNQATQVLTHAIEKFGISMRGVNRLIKVARTIADLKFADNISKSDIATAVTLRMM